MLANKSARDLESRKKFAKEFLKLAGASLAQRFCVFGGKIVANIYGNPPWHHSLIGMLDNQAEMALLVQEEFVRLGATFPEHLKNSGVI